MPRSRHDQLVMFVSVKEWDNHLRTVFPVNLLAKGDELRRLVHLVHHNNDPAVQPLCGSPYGQVINPSLGPVQASKGALPCEEGLTPFSLFEVSPSQLRTEARRGEARKA